MRAAGKPVRDSADPARAAFLHGNLLLAVRLLNSRERIAFACLAAGRIAIGLCDLAVAGAYESVFRLEDGSLVKEFSPALPRGRLGVPLHAEDLLQSRCP